MTLALILAGAAVGAPLRYYAGRAIQPADASYPVGTLIVNLSGCLLIGLLLGLGEERQWPGREARLLLVTGFLGSYTTFSAFGWESLSLLRDGDVVRAFSYVLLSTAGGLAAAWLGLVAARQLG